MPRGYGILRSYAMPRSYVMPRRYILYANTACVMRDVYSPRMLWTCAARRAGLGRMVRRSGYRRYSIRH